MFTTMLERTAAALRLTQNEIKTMGKKKTLKALFERSAAAVTIRPAIGQGTDATTVSLIDGTECKVEEASWEFTSDLDPELGGSKTNPGPGFFLRAALGTCFTQTAALWAAKLGVPIHSLEVKVKADHDARGLLGVGEVPPRFTSLRYEITVASTAPEEDVQRVLDSAYAHSPVRDSIEHDLSVARDVRIVEPVSR